MIAKKITYLFMATIIICTNCKDASESYTQPQISSNADISFLNRVSDILNDTDTQRKFDDSTDLYLTKHPDVVVLYKQSHSNVEEVKRLLTDKTIPYNHKRLSILLMQCLPLSDYLELVNFIAENARIDKIDNKLLSEALYPGVEWGSIVAENYSNEKVVNILSALKSNFINNKSISEKIGSILSGDIAAYIKHLKETGYNVPLKCE